MRPKILLTPYHDGNDVQTRLSFSYTNAVLRSGGLPFIAALTDDKDIIREYVRRCDAIILTGGGDIAPELMGLDEKAKCNTVSRIRDAFEFELVLEAYKQDKPTLGICRGMQVMNFVLGGTLFEDIPNHKQECPREIPIHYINISGFLSEFYPPRAFVNSYHHQAVDRVAEVLDVCAVSDEGYTEGIYAKDKTFFVGVQWHPENLADEPSKLLFDKLIKNLL